MPVKAEPSADRIRFDKWLWAARFYRTRGLAALAIDAGQARIDDARVKPAHAVRVGQRVQIRRNALTWNVEVMALSERRGGGADAQKLYREDATSVAERDTEIGRRKAVASTAPTSDGRPTKRDRRKLQEFLDEP